MFDIFSYIVTVFIINQCSMVTKFKNHLAKTNLAKNTVTSYVWTVQYFLNHYGEVNKKNLLAYKGYLVENFKPQTVNLRLQGINKYLEFTKQEKLKVYLEPHNNQKQSEISKRKSLITNTFYKLTLFGCFLSLPKFPHIFDTYF